MAEDEAIDRTDRNWWWRLSAGEQQNQYEQQEDRAEVAESILRKLLKLGAIEYEPPYISGCDSTFETATFAETTLLRRLAAGGEGS